MTPSERDQMLPLLQGRDFTACFLAAHGLSNAIKSNPELASPETVLAFSSFLKRYLHSGQSKAFFSLTAGSGVVSAAYARFTKSTTQIASCTGRLLFP